MPKFVPDFESIQVKCPKPNCERTFLHRHHKGHEAIWVGLFTKHPLTSDRDGWTEDKIRELHDNYYAFRDQDIGLICAWHHAEIHLLYDTEIEKDQRRKGYRPLGKYTYREARSLIRRLQSVYEVWVLKDTPGVDPAYLQSFRDFPLMKGELKV